METKYSVVVGTYEEFLLGYDFLPSKQGSYNFVLSFSNHAHTHSIRCIASDTKFLASGSADETIQLFNMKTRQELGCLQHHNGTITGLEFYGSYLFSGSEDGTICVWSTKTWKCEKTLSGHERSVNDISIHPSGKMALSVSKDKTLRTWNLIKGRSAYVTNIKKEADIVVWSKKGDLFLLCAGNIVDVYSVETAGVMNKIDAKCRVHAIICIDEHICAIGVDSGKIIFYHIKNKKELKIFTAHSSRIKSLSSMPSEDGRLWLFSVSSDGYLKAWDVKFTEEEVELDLLSEVNTTCRPTCLTVFTDISS